ncbi:unnamed protein product [Owenia fusiformis]|uniref:Uncharacterized protein n=1 Tax=Owenia fusiformis TaxID=6347 RepID=A0A8J1USV1_OWEFU|nr:unnamed protein product [Owenia fusiformis]
MKMTKKTKYFLAGLAVILGLNFASYLLFGPKDESIKTPEKVLRADSLRFSAGICKSIVHKTVCLGAQECGWCTNNDTPLCVEGTKDGAENHHCSSWCFSPHDANCRSYKKLIVFGNGPSLKGFDFFKTKGVDTLGMNLAFRYWKQIDWWPTYYASFDTVVNIAHIPELMDMIENSEKRGMKLFFTRSNIAEENPQLKNHPKVKFYENIKAASDQNMVKVTREISTGALAARIGQYLGYEKILLLGIDMNYVEYINGSTRHKGGTLIMKETPKNNSNYFFSNYQVKGDVYNVPNNEVVHVTAFKQILEDTKKHPEFNVEYFNGSPVSRLNGIGYKFMKFEDFMKL